MTGAVILIFTFIMMIMTMNIILSYLIQFALVGPCRFMIKGDTNMIYAVELFSGNADITKALNSMPNVICKSVDFEPKYKADLCIDVFDIKDFEHLRKLLGFPRVDFIWASPDCSSYSLASVSRYVHRLKGGAPNSDYACLSDRLNIHLWRDILLPAVRCGCHYIVENPRGFYRKAFGRFAPFQTTIFYNNYDDNFSLKPTDLFYSDFCFTGFVNFQWDKHKKTHLM